MIKGGRAMANMFEKYAADREVEQRKIGLRKNICP